MSRKCQVTGKTPMTGHNVSHAHNVSKRRFLPNLQRKRFWSHEEKRFVTLTVTALVVPGVFAVVMGARRQTPFGPTLLAGAVATGFASGVVATGFMLFGSIGGREYPMVATLFGSIGGMLVGLATEGARRGMCLFSNDSRR